MRSDHFNRHMEVLEKNNFRNDDTEIILPTHQTNNNDYHLFNDTQWKNFYDQLMIKPNDTLEYVNPHYQIIAIILGTGEEDVGRSFMTKLKTFHSN